MKLLSFSTSAGDSFGMVTENGSGDGVVDLGQRLGGQYADHAYNKRPLLDQIDRNAVLD